jgi:hypothetical protein
MVSVLSIGSDIRSVLLPYAQVHLWVPLGITPNNLVLLTPLVPGKAHNNSNSKGDQYSFRK